jgi:hypothetical protein
MDVVTPVAVWLFLGFAILILAVIIQVKKGQACPPCPFLIDMRINE